MSEQEVRNEKLEKEVEILKISDVRGPATVAATLYKETEDLFDRSVVTREICELRNIINTAYLVIKHAMERKESRGLHYTLDYPEKITL